ncbi:hypothetical protein D3C87_1664820 [compost metagenome]
MKQRHRNAQSIVGGQLDGLPQEKTVIKYAAMRQGSALRRACRATGELNIDRIGILECCANFPNAFICRVARSDQVAEAQKTGNLLFTQLNHRSQERKFGRVQCSRRGAVYFRREAPDQLEVISGLEGRQGYQCLATRLVQSVFELGGPVSRVEIDEDEANLGRR